MACTPHDCCWNHLEAGLRLPKVPSMIVRDRVQLLSRGKGNTGDGMHRDGDGCFSCPPRILAFNAAGTRTHATTGRPLPLLLEST